MRLNPYLREHRLARSEFARLVDVTTDTVQKWLKGQLPKPEHVIAIYRITKGAVGPADFYRLPKLRGMRDADAAE